MAKLMVVLDVDLDPTLEDPQEVAEDLLYDSSVDNKGLRQYAGCETRIISADWIKQVRGGKK